MMKRLNVIGLTGGIGAGKTAASARFFRLAAQVIDADVLARRALELDGVCYDAVIRAFGRGILREDHSIDRKALAQIVFSDEGKRQRLNDIVHPAVIGDMLLQARRLVQEDARAVVILDVPLLFECGMQRETDASVLVAAEEKTRIRRVTLRDGCPEADAAARIRAQMPQTEKERLADYVISNDGPLDALNGQADALYQRFLGTLL